MITIAVKGRRATASGLVPLPTGNVQSIKTQVQIPADDPLWQNALIVAVFAAKTPKGSWIVRPGVVDEQRQTIIPGDVLRIADADIFVGIRGTYANNREVTTNMVSLGKTAQGAGGEIVDLQIADVELTEATAFLSQISSYIQHEIADMRDDIENINKNQDTLVPLALGTVYPSMSVRADWYDVPAYALGEYAAVAQLSSDTTVGGYAESKIMLSYPPDYSTGMPCPMLTVHTGGDLFACFPTLYHDLGADRQAGWYAGSGMEYLGQTAPTLSDMSFDRLVIFEDNGDTTRTEYTDLTDLPAKARSALDMLSRMVNVSTSAMGTLGVVENGVQRLTHAPQFGRHYAFITDSDFELPFPSTAWTPDDASFTLDLYCTSDVAMTLPRDRLMDNGKQPDTSAGYHRLTFRYNHNADKISVGEVTQVVPQYWDDIPDEVTTLENCTWPQIKSIATHGYVNRQGQWCIRRNDQEEVWFEIGDEKSIELSTGETWTLQIWDFMHDDLADGSGKSSITFGMKGLTSDTYKMNTTDTISGGWEQCYFRTQTLPTILNTLPQALRSVIVPVSKVSSAGDATTLVTTSDALFLPSSREYGDIYDKPYGEGEKYTIFINSSPGLSYNYWTRTSYSEDRANKWRYVNTDGRVDSYIANTATTMYRVRFAFCI